MTTFAGIAAGRSGLVEEMDEAIIANRYIVWILVVAP